MTPINLHQSPNKVWAAVMVEELARQGVQHICIAPGSRSTLLAIAAADSQLKTWVHFDERSLGFFALGLAKAGAGPVAIITTSGTAVANLYPAVIEAFQSRIPLIVLSADRPPELQQCGANQTIDQTHIFGQYVRHQTRLPVPDTSQLDYVLTSIDQAVALSQYPVPGPVHINCPFREPFNDPNVIPGRAISNKLADWAGSDAPFHTSEPISQSNATTLPERPVDQLSNSVKGLIVVGNLNDNDMSDQAIAHLLELGWPVVADIGSGMRWNHHPNMISYLDAMLTSDRVNDRPDTILWVGGQITSKAVRQLVQETGSIVQIKPHYDRLNEAHSPMTSVVGDVSQIVLSIRSLPNSGLLAGYQTLNHTVSQLLDDYSGDSTEISEIQMVRQFSKLPLGEINLFVSNSMPVRAFDQFAAPTNAPPQVVVNRGASGIDGILSTAAGVAAQTEKKTILVTGDLAALHDIGALSFISQNQLPLAIVIWNNFGGGIFKFLPVAKNKAHFETYFHTSHAWQFKEIAGGFNIPFIQARTPNDVGSAIDTLATVEEPMLIEVQYNSQKNLDAYTELKKVFYTRLECDRLKR